MELDNITKLCFYRMMHILTQKDHKEKEVGEEKSNESLGLMLGSAFGRKCHAVEKK